MSYYKLTHREYFEALKEGRLMGLKCRECSGYTAPPKVSCDVCGGTELEAVQLSGRGEIKTFTVVRVAPEGLEARELPFSEDYAAYARALKNLAPDIGLAPLEDTPFNRCKSAVKWLEYSALGAAGVYADLAPYAPVRHGETGLKAGADPDLWEDALMRLVADKTLRRDMGERARAEVLAHWGLRAGAEGYFKVWQEAARAGK